MAIEIKFSIAIFIVRAIFFIKTISIIDKFVVLGIRYQAERGRLLKGITIPYSYRHLSYVCMEYH